MKRDRGSKARAELGREIGAPSMTNRLYSSPDEDWGSGRHEPQKLGSPKRKKASFDARFLAKSITRSSELIPGLSDHDRWAHSRKPMDIMVHGCSTSLFQAWQQWSRMSS